MDKNRRQEKNVQIRKEMRGEMKGVRELLEEKKRREMLSSNQFRLAKCSLNYTTDGAFGSGKFKNLPSSLSIVRMFYRTL